MAVTLPSARSPLRPPPQPPDGRFQVGVPTRDTLLTGSLEVPRQARGVVVLARALGGSAGGALGERLCRRLRRAGLATLSVDLLGDDEDVAAQDDVWLLTERLVSATDWLGLVDGLDALPLAYFGEGVASAAALLAAPLRAARVHAIASLDGRPDLSGPALAAMAVPTLMLVGGDDPVVLSANRAAFHQLKGLRSLEVIPSRSAGRYDVAAADDGVIASTCRWFGAHLPRPLIAAHG